jgi:hypothetical protein
MACVGKITRQRVKHQTLVTCRGGEIGNKTGNDKYGKYKERYTDSKVCFVVRKYVAQAYSIEI